MPVKREREQTSKSQQMKKQQIIGNASLMSRAREVNKYDLQLYQLGSMIDFFLLTVDRQGKIL